MGKPGPMAKEIREKLSLAGKERFKKAKYRDVLAPFNFKKGHRPSEEIKQKMSEAQKERCKNPEIRAKAIINVKEANKQRWEKPDAKEKANASQKASWQNPEIRQRRIAGIKKSWANPNSKGRRANAEPERRKKISIAHKKLWSDPKFVRFKFERYQVKPNRSELKLEALLNRIVPNEYRYVGNGAFVLAGKIPDFVNVNGQKKIIELNSLYWHRNDNPQDRIDLFKSFGYNTLILWENDLRLKDLASTEAKILAFNGEPHL